MSIGIAGVLNSLSSHASSLGFFENVLTHEPKSAPTGPACAIFVSQIAPFKERSGLTSISVVLVLTVRLYANMLQDPQDDIDRDIVVAADALMTAYAGDFDLGDENREIDLLGISTPGVGLEAGYLTQDSTLFRVMDITVPVIINDVWTEAR